RRGTRGGGPCSSTTPCSWRGGSRRAAPASRRGGRARADRPLHASSKNASELLLLDCSYSTYRCEGRFLTPDYHRVEDGGFRRLFPVGRRAPRAELRRRGDHGAPGGEVGGARA